MRFNFGHRTGLAAAAGLALTVAACGDFVSSPQVGPDDPVAFLMPTVDGQACVYNAGAGPATFTIAGDPAVGTYSAGSPFTVNPMAFGECLLVWEGAGATILTVTEVLQPGWRVNRIDLVHDGAAAVVHHFPAPVASVTFPFSATDRAIIKVFTEPYDPPSNGDEGCTPGFWRQSHHFGHWVLDPTDLFLTHFERNAFPEQALSQVVELEGGGLNALGRHAVAALLNSLSLDVEYGLDSGQVVLMFQDAFDSGNSDRMEETKDEFEALNEAGCPL